MTSFCCYLCLAYQPPETDGLLNFLVSKSPPKYLEKIDPIVFDQRDDGSASLVVSVNGVKDFKRSVVVPSFQKPVVTMVYSGVVAQEAQMKKLFQDVAQRFGSDVAFVSLNMLAKQGSSSENYLIIANLMAQENIQRVTLPLFLCFRNGQLMIGQDKQTAFLQGTASFDDLVGFIEQKSAINQQITATTQQAPGMFDVTVTGTNSAGVNATKTGPQQQPKKGFINRIKGIFRK